MDACRAVAVHRWVRPGDWKREKERKKKKKRKWPGTWGQAPRPSSPARVLGSVPAGTVGCQEREREEMTRILGLPGGQLGYILPFFTRDRRICMDGSDRSRVCWATLSPGGLAISRPRPRLRPGTRGRARGSYAGRFRLLGRAKVTKTKKNVRMALCWAAAREQAAQAARGRGLFWPNCTVHTVFSFFFFQKLIIDAFFYDFA